MKYLHVLIEGTSEGSSGGGGGWWWERHPGPVRPHVHFQEDLRRQTAGLRGQGCEVRYLLRMVHEHREPPRP